MISISSTITSIIITIVIIIIMMIIIIIIIIVIISLSRQAFPACRFSLHTMPAHICERSSHVDETTI